MAAAGVQGGKGNSRGSGDRVRASLSVSPPEREGLTRVRVRGAHYRGCGGFGDVGGFGVRVGGLPGSGVWGSWRDLGHEGLEAWGYGLGSWGAWGWVFWGSWGGVGGSGVLWFLVGVWNVGGL